MSDDAIGADQSPGEGSSAPECQPEAGWPPHRARESALSDLRDGIVSNPDALDLRFEAACLLAEMGRTLEARDAYLDLLTREPSHRLALNRSEDEHTSELQ